VPKAEPGFILDLEHRNLARRHLGPLVKGGVLKLRCPKLPSHRFQAYRVPEALPPETGTGGAD
jgi:hypothetical protein